MAAVDVGTPCDRDGQSNDRQWPGRPEAPERGSAGESRCVLALVVRAELARLDRLPPVAPLAVPLDGRPQALLEPDLRRPAERAQLRAVEAVAPVVPRPVLDVLQQGGVGA